MDEFLAVAHQYQLGDLDTEGQHPFTVSLSELAKDDLGEAIRELQRVDVLAMRRFELKAAGLRALATAIHDTLAASRRIYFCGCGATGRLSLSLEVFCRDGTLNGGLCDRVIGFMAGGDLALIKSIENFEDHPEFGARQLAELGFGEGDLLIGSSEGGETPFVIGAIERAAELSRNPPWFLYCNPDDKLCRTAERSKRVIENPAIRKLNLSVGPMAISGSTRMQASTVLMAAIGFAIQHRDDPAAAQREVTRFREVADSVDFSFLEAFIDYESSAYQRGEFVLYESPDYGITVVTDTTERAPTFSLPPFENQAIPSQPVSWCYFHLPGRRNAGEAWEALLGRRPRTLEWPEVRQIAGARVLEGYDFSDQLIAKRWARTSGALHHTFRIQDHDDLLSFEFDGLRHAINLAGIPPFSRHLVLKMALNIHSTLVMGRLGRYLDNLMTFVKPSNNKLIDRAIRYVRLLLQRRNGKAPDYATVARALFEQKAVLKPGEPIVLRTIESLRRRMAPVAAPA